MIEKLRQLKKKSHMTNQQIAEKSSIPESTVARIFSGKTLNPTVTTVISMARAMGGSAADLLSEEDEKIADAKSDAGESAVAGAAESPAASDNTNAGAQPGENKPIARDFQILADGAANEKFYEDMNQLRGISINLNQIARKANSLGLVDAPFYRKTYNKLNEFMQHIKKEYLDIEKGT